MISFIKEKRKEDPSESPVVIISEAAEVLKFAAALRSPWLCLPINFHTEIYVTSLNKHSNSENPFCAEAKNPSFI